MTVITPKREKMGITVSKKVKQQAEEYSNTSEYASTSNFVENAISYYIGALNKENELKYEECKKELERLRKENERHSSALLKLLTNHPELINEVNSYD